MGRKRHALYRLCRLLGPAIVGHAHPEVIEAVREAALGGLSFGAPTEGEIVIAEEIAKIMPSVEQLRLVSSGTEATMTAIRLARGFTGRDKIIKFEGCYHGHSDSLLVKAGSGLLTFGNPSSAGVPADFTKHTLVLEYNNIAQLEEAFAQSGNDIACVILEPFVGNMNLVRPSEAFVKALRELTEKHGAVLIYDEVMTGFRVALGGAQSLHGIKPDLTTMGKVIGGGMPLAAFGGRKDIMECISPLGGVYQAGTLSGNPIAVAAGLKTLEIIQREGFYGNLTALTNASPTVLPMRLKHMALNLRRTAWAVCLVCILPAIRRKTMPTWRVPISTVSNISSTVCSTAMSHSARLLTKPGLFPPRIRLS